MNRIKQLSKHLINQIAAGEVIERPYSVVKELVENSIDAQSTRIEISISNSCRNIRIADNGSGIHPDDIELAFTKHATSKLIDENGLFNINTLGFRGEALSSIISIAKVTCITRTKDFEYGTKVESQNSVINTSKTGCAIGTIMQVNDLFFNQPARLKFLKSEKTEFAYIQELIQALSIANPSIAFILKNGNTTVINTTQNSDLLTRISQIYSTEIINSVKEVKKSDKLSGLYISGFVSTPDYTRTSKKSIYTFVNSRIVKCPVILKAIDIAYKNMMPNGRYPFVVLNLQINPEDIDVNVHPQKREIRYKNANQIFNFVISAIDSALNENLNINHFEQKNDEEKVISFSDIKKSENDDTIYIQHEETKSDYTFPLKMVKQNDKYSFKDENINQTKMDIKYEKPVNFHKVKIIGQYNNTYILVENDDNLEIIDQHIAQERYIYESLKEQKEIASQLLIVSDVIDIEPSDMELIENSKAQLEKFGYKTEKISDTQIIFKKIPQVLAKVKLQDILAELIKNLKMSTNNDLDTIEEKILITTACRASVKAGDELTLWQMEEIVNNLRKTKNPYTCPHGRPISHHFPLKEIASFFDRNIN